MQLTPTVVELIVAKGRYLVYLVLTPGSASSRRAGCRDRPAFPGLTPAGFTAVALLELIRAQRI